MSLFRGRSVAPVVPEERGFVRIPVSGANGYFYAQAGMPAESDPLKSVAHWAARRVLCTSIAGLPVHQYRERRGRARERMDSSEVVASPSSSLSQMLWVYSVMDSWLDAGNVYGDIRNTSSLALPTQVEILAPGAVTWRIDGGEYVPWVGGEARKVWPRGDLWHAPCFVRAGCPIGLSPSEYAGQSVATSVAAEKFGGDFFAASGHPTYDVEASVDITQEQAEGIKAGFLNSVQNRQPWVHGNTISAKPMNVDPKSSQFIELLQFECLQAARIYGVPPTMIYAAISGSSVTYANASQDDLAFLKHSLRWWVRLLNAEWSKWLPAPQFVRLNVDAFLEMTAEERTRIHGMRLEQKTRTVNEVRRIEDEEPFGAEFDEPGIPGGSTEGGGA